MRTILLLAGLLLSSRARAVTIEGQTPSGGVQQVGVTDEGQLQVNLNNVTLTVSSFNIAGQPISVYVTSGTVTVATGTITAVPPVTTSTSEGNGSNAGGSGFEVLPPSSSRLNSCITNECGTPLANCGAYMRVGDASVSATVGYPILPGGSYCPDDPGSFQGELYGASTAPVQWSWISH